MLVMIILLLLSPALISLLLYERFKAQTHSNLKRVALLFVFAFLINMIAYAAIWLRGWDYISWSLNSSSTMTMVSFCLKYMAISLLFAIIIPFVLSLIEIGKHK